jgi:hypothetical protein
MAGKGRAAVHRCWCLPLPGRGSEHQACPGSGATVASVKLQVLARVAEGVILKAVDRLLSWWIAC